MSAETQVECQAAPCYRAWLQGTLLLLGAVVVARFVLEIAGTPASATRYFSSSAGVFLAALYLGSVASRRGVTKLVQLLLPSL